jgi:hypothetical protein
VACGRPRAKQTNKNGCRSAKKNGIWQKLLEIMMAFSNEINPNLSFF